MRTARTHEKAHQDLHPHDDHSEYPDYREERRELIGCGDKHGAILTRRAD